MPSDRNTNSSTTRPSRETCAEAMNMALLAAHDVEVGDYSFKENNYRGALLRYNEALEQKPEDVAIHVRMGRVLEKLKRVPECDRTVQGSAETRWPRAVVSGG